VHHPQPLPASGRGGDATATELASPKLAALNVLTCPATWPQTAAPGALDVGVQSQRRVVVGRVGHRSGADQAKGAGQALGQQLGTLPAVRPAVDRRHGSDPARPHGHDGGHRGPRGSVGVPVGHHRDRRGRHMGSLGDLRPRQSHGLEDPDATPNLSHLVPRRRPGPIHQGQDATSLCFALGRPRSGGIRDDSTA
jgi:hypothetical protein